MDRNELKRLQKAAKSNDKLSLGIWASNFEMQIRGDLERLYRQKYINDLTDSVDILLTAIAYTLHFSEEIKLGRKRLPKFMEDLIVTIDMFRTGEYNNAEYREELKKCGIVFADYNYEKISKKAKELFTLERVPLEQVRKEIDAKFVDED